MKHTLIERPDELRELLRPVLDGEVSEFAFDTETTEIVDDYFTTYGTDVKMAGFSISFDRPDGSEVDLYVPVRHQPYDWRRRPDLIAGDLENDGPGWLRRLTEIEGVTPPCEGSGYPGGEWAELSPNLHPADVFPILGEALWTGAIVFAHNAHFDARILERDGLLIPWERLLCTQAASIYTDPRPLDLYDEDANEYVHGGHALKHLGEVWLGVPADAQALLQQAKQALGVGSARLEDYSMLPLRTAIAPYAAMDTRLTLKLAHHIRQREAWKLPAVQALLEEHRRELPIIMAMEREGLHVNRELASARAEEKRAERSELIQKMKKLAGRDVPVDSPTRLREVLYGDLGIPRFRGNDDTRDATLKHLRTKLVADGEADWKAELLDAIRDYRSVSKEISSFYDPLAKGGDVIHPIIRQLGARTLRQTASKPNAHQMKKPKKGSDPTTSVRHLIRPSEGSVFVCADYSAQEMRGAAHYTVAIPEAFPYRFTWRCTLQRRGDCKGKPPHGPKEIHVGWRETIDEAPSAFYLHDGFLNEGTSFDPHQKMVEMVARENYDLDRDKCKTGDFAILYGCGGPKLADTLNIPISTAYKLIRLFWDRAYPELNRVKTFISERLRKIGPETKWSHQDYISTMHGAPIYLSDGYKGLNYVVQRSCREILLKATIACQQYIDENGLADDYRIALTVHDEIIFEIREAHLDQVHVRALCRRMVEAGAKSRVPMVVEPKLARVSWATKEALPAEWGWNGVTDE